MKIVPSAAKGTRLEFTRSLRMASVAGPPGPLSALYQKSTNYFNIVSTFLK